MNQFYTKQKYTDQIFSRKNSGRILINILSALIVLFISLVSVQTVHAQALPDATQDFTGYGNMNDGTDRWISPDDFFILNASRPSRINADEWGAFLSDSQAEGIEKTDWFEIIPNPASNLAGFEVEDVFIGEYDYGIPVARFQNVIVQGFQGETVVAETVPFTSQSDNEETRYPIDYSVFKDLQIDRFRITFTSNSETPPDVFNLVEFTIKNASTEAPEPSNNPPAVLTASVFDITAIEATLSGEVTDDGGDTVTERGFVYATSGSPTTSDSKVESGSGIGEFSESISGLDPETTYYVKAYAINGAGTSYGSEESFTTDAATSPPAFTSTPFTEAEYEKNFLYSISATLEGELSTTISAPTLPEWLTLNTEGQAEATQIGNVMDLAYLGGAAGDDDGNIYAATSTGTHIFKIEPDGTTTQWISGLPSGSVFALHVAGNYLYIPRHNNPNESITRIALDDQGAGVEQFASFNGGAMSLTDHGDWIYAASYGSTQVKRIHKSNKTVETVLTSTDGLPANGPFGLAFDDEDNLYIATFSNNSVLKYDGIELTTAISGLPRFVSSVKTDASGNFYISMDSGGIRKYDSGWNDFTYISPGQNDNIYSISFTNTGALVYALFYTNQVYRLQTGTILSGTPAKADVGDHPVVLEASNSAGSTQQSFTIEVQDNVPPVVESFTPAHNGTDVDRDPEFSITFDEEITLAETGVLNLHAGTDDSPFASFDLSVTDDKDRFDISEDERTLIFNYGTSFTAGTQITVTLSEGFVEDAHGNQFAGFDFETATWQFTIRELISQTIDFTEPDGKTWGDAEFQLGPSTSSEGLTVTYIAEDEDVLSIDGNTATILKAGSTKVTATQAGNDDVAAADPVEQTVTIFKAELTVSVDEDQAKIYGEDDPAFTFEATGFVNDENEGIITGALDREEGEDSGTYDILNGDLSAGDNYTIDFKGSLFSITPAALTITAAENQSKTFGQIDPDFSFSSSVFAFDDNADVLTGSLSREEGENAGNYAITQGNLDSENYTITFDPADFEITPTALSVTADEDQSKTYGEADGALTFSTSGFAFDDDAGILTGSLTRESGEEVGSYTIELGDLNAGSNYDLSFVSADLEITPRELSIVAAADQSKTYGEADPAFTFDATNFGWSDDELVLTGSLARDAGEDVGTYSFTQGDLNAGDNYTIDFTGAAFEITPRELIVEADAGQTKVYGETDPALTFTATGFDLGDDENLITGSLDRASGEDAGSYEITPGNISAGDNYSIQFTVADFEITPRTLVLSDFVADNKAYDGSTEATGTGFDDDRLTGDEVTFDYDVAFSDEGAGDNKDVLFTNIQIIGGSDQNNYELQTADGVATANIARRELTITADGHSITYGEDNPALTYEITSGSLVTGDPLSGSLERVSGLDVGTYSIQQGDLTAGSNYDLSFVSADLEITPRELTIVADADQSKTYGESDPAFTFDAANFGWSDDELVLSGALARNAGEDVDTYTINRGDLDVGGNYTIEFTTSNFEITPKDLLVEVDAGQTKVYGDVDPTFTFTANGFELGDDENLITGSIDRASGEDAGSYEIGPGNISAGDNYSIQFTAADFEVTPRLLVLMNFVADDKTYDGSTDATGTGFDDDRLTGDELTFDYDVAFSDKNAGDDKGVLFTNLQISGGSDLNNYDLQTTTGTASAVISQRSLTIAADGHTITYGEDDPALTYDITSGSFVTGDELSGALDRNPGLNVGIYTIQLGDLTAGSNYDLSFVSADLEITQRELIIVADSDQFKTYGEADPTITFDAANFGWNDDESVLSGALARNAGEDVDTYTINRGDLDVGGNYMIDFTGASFEITPRDLIVVTDAGQTKMYGETDPALTFTATGFDLGDDEQILSGVLDRAPGEDAGTYEIQSGDLSAGDNYDIQFTASEFEITPRVLLLSDFVADSKTYDGSTNTTGTGFSDDRVENDDLEFSYEVAFSDENAALDKDVLFTNLQISGGSDQNNYNLQATSGTAIADIARRDLTIAANADTITYGEEDPEFTYEITSGNLVSGDQISGGLQRVAAKGVGTYAIQQGDLTAGNNYNLNFEVAFFEITRRTLTILAESGQSKLYGENDPVLTFEAGNFGWDDDEGILTGSLGRADGEGVGRFAITSGDLVAGNNYTIDFTSANFEILPSELIVRANTGQTKVYGEDDPEFTYEVIGLNSGDDPSIITGNLSRQSGEHAGMYNITIGNLDAGDNYLVTFEDTGFEISRRTLTILAETGQSKVYGENDPAFTFEAVNFGWDDDEDILAGALSRESGIDAGVYKILLNTLNAGDNYTIDINSAEFTVLPKELKIVADNDHWKFIGEEDPLFTYQANGFEYSDDESVLSGLLERETGEETGQYSITMGSLDAGSNYVISLIGSDFSILMTAPKADRLTPETDQMKVSIDEPIVVEFDQEIISVDPGLITLKDADGNELTIDAVAGTDRLTLNHTGLSNQEMYTVTVPEGTVKNSDEILNREIEWSFSTIMAEPVVKGHSPKANEERVSVSNEIIVEFSQPVTVADEGKVILTDSNENIIPATISTNEEHLTIKHEGFSYFTQYTVTLLEGAIQNADEVQNRLYSWSFTTVVTVPDPVVLKTPVGGLGSVSLHPIVEWEESEFAEVYRIQISSNNSFEPVIVDQEEIAELSWTTVDELDAYTGYFWRVEALNTSGRSGWSETGEFYTLAVTPDPVFPIQNSERISIAPTLEWASGYETQFRVQLSETENFVNLLSDSLTAETAFGLTGLDSNRNYYWRVRVESDRTTSEWLDAQSFLTRPAPQDDSENYLVQKSIDFGGTSSSENRHISQMDYRMIGLPGGEQHKLMDFFEGKYGTEWKAFLENGADTEYYEEFNVSDSRFMFAPGEGFWVLSKDILELDLNIQSVEINEKDAYRITLHPGWNIISNPHRNAVSWQDVKELNDISMDLFGYDQRFTIEDSLRSVQGFYIYNDPNNLVSTIDIPYTQMRQRRGENGMAAEKAGLKSAMKVSPSSAVVSASFNNGHTFSAELVYNVSPGDEGRYLKYYPSLEMSKTGMMFTDDSIRRGGLIRGESRYDETGREYRLELKGYVGDTFEWEARLNGLGDQARVLLVNPATNLTWLLAHGETVEVKLSEPHAIYNVHIGNEQYLLNKQQSIMPVEISLMQNYPNPFNPTTNIRFAITEQQHVRLEIYDVIGRRVQVLQDGILQAGWHNAQFDGRSLASGIYFYRLQTGSVVKVRQMSMIK